MMPNILTNEEKLPAKISANDLDADSEDMDVPQESENDIEYAVQEVDTEYGNLEEPSDGKQEPASNLIENSAEKDKKKLINLENFNKLAERRK